MNSPSSSKNNNNNNYLKLSDKQKNHAKINVSLAL